MAWGTQIIKEITSIQTGEGCDTTTSICTNQLGAEIFEGRYSGLGMIVKDSEDIRHYPATGDTLHFSGEAIPGTPPRDSVRKNSASPATLNWPPTQITSLSKRTSGSCPQTSSNKLSHP
jgi:hypothetical protein